MGAKILQMAERSGRSRCNSSAILLPEDWAAKYLLVRTDERGKAAYFIRVHITGLHARVFGPFRTEDRCDPSL